MRLRDPLDFPFGYAADLVAEVERTSCSKGCKLAVPVPGVGPGGACVWLGCTFTGERVPFERHAGTVRCLAREPLDVVPVHVECDGQEPLFGGAA